jgi:hypothetical protein
VVNEVNSAPVLGAITNYTINELTFFSVTNAATDTDIPANILTYTLNSPPAGMTISTNGVITWTPSEAEGPSTNLITTVVTDNGVPPLSATNAFTIVVDEVNSAPVLGVIPNETINELTFFSVTNAATDTDIPANILTYTLINPPAGMTISTNGVITWTPSEAQGPGTNLITTVATDNGVPPLSATNSFTIVVNEVNSAPVLGVIPNYTINDLTTFAVTNAATDTDIPANTLTYTLINPPAGMVINASGVITWTPSVLQGLSTNLITTVVTDNGVPPLSATNSFTVVVNGGNTPPVLGTVSNYTIVALTLFTVTNAATDAEVPPEILTYTLVSPPAGMTISTNGVISWTPAANQAPSTNLITTVVTDNGVPPLSATNSFSVVVVPSSNSPPVLGHMYDYTINELSPFFVLNAATDADAPPEVLTYALINPPAGMAISTNGLISWTPTEAQGPSTNLITTVVTDNGAPPLSATNTFTVVVDEVNSAPVLGTLTNRIIRCLVLFSVSNAATDTDIPANILTYTLINPPAGMAISTNGLITWTPSADQELTTNLITTVVTDNGSPPLSATNSFTLVVGNATNSPPILPVLPDLTVVQGTFLTITNIATDTDIPATTNFYMLVNPPPGAKIYQTNGVIEWATMWTPAPSTNVIETVATDNGVPPMSATNRFTVVLVVGNQPIIQGVQLSNTTAIITWRTVAGRTYRVQSIENLEDTNWLSLTPDITAAGPLTTAEDTTATSTHRYYRVILLP